MSIVAAMLGAAGIGAGGSLLTSLLNRPRRQQLPGGFQMPEGTQQSINMLNAFARQRLGPGFSALSPLTMSQMRKQGRFDIMRMLQGQERGTLQDLARTFGGGAGSGQVPGGIRQLRQTAVRAAGDVSRAVSIKGAELTRDERLAALGALGQAASLGLQGAGMGQTDVWRRFGAQQQQDVSQTAFGLNVGGGISNMAQMMMLALAMQGGGGFGQSGVGQPATAFTNPWGA